MSYHGQGAFCQSEGDLHLSAASTASPWHSAKTTETAMALLAFLLLQECGFGGLTAAATWRPATIPSSRNRLPKRQIMRGPKCTRAILLSCAAARLS